jgi:hypothetical protein
MSYDWRDLGWWYQRWLMGMASQGKEREGGRTVAGK